jgi:glycine oxidase
LIVAGGGIVGLSCAWRLAQRGHPVTVFDARETGAEASWAAAGMLAPGGETLEDSALTRMALAGLAQYPAFIHELREASQVEVEFRRCGAMEVAFTAAEADELEGRAKHQEKLGIRSEAAMPGDFAGARFFPDDAVVNPRELMPALKVACVRSGVAIREHEPVVEILENGRAVRTEEGIYRDDSVLIAAGAWSSALAGVGFSARSAPVRGHLIAYADPPKLDHILRRGATYLLPRRGTLVAGSSTEDVGFNRCIDWNIVADIRKRAECLLPELARMTPTEVWNGLRPGIENGGGPVIGRIPGTHIRVAFGHYRNGILLAPETARIVAAEY